MKRRTAHRAWRAAAALALLCAGGCSGCRRPAPPPPPPARLAPETFNGRQALQEALDFVAVGPRVAGTPGGERAANYLFERLKTLGLDPSLDVFRDRTPEGEKTFRNVTVTLPGTGTGSVVLASHFDTKSGISDAFVGANDSGSSSGLLLALAQHLAAGPRLDLTVICAWLDGEECLRDYGPRDGLHGSRRLLRRLQDRRAAAGLRAFLLLDMIGDRHLTVTIPRNCTPDLVSRAFEAARAEGCRLQFTRYPAEIVDDHVPFLEAGIPALVLIDFDYGAAPGRNDYWHTERDTPDKLSAESLQTVGRVALRLLDGLNRAP